MTLAIQVDPAFATASQQHKRKRVKFFWGAALTLLIIASCPTLAQTQAPAKPPPAAQTLGRFQLLAQPEGAIFMIDSATGRVWRVTSVTATEQQVQAYIDKLIAAEERERGLKYSDLARKAREAALKIERADAIATLVNPCLGLRTCLLQLDRVRLTSTGEFTSEIVKP